MKILLAHFKIQDYGGIVNYSEFLARGFKQLGHEVDAVMLRHKGKTGYPKAKDRELDEGWEYGHGLDLWMHQKQGWEGMYVLNYQEDVQHGEDWAADYDLVIYVIPVPTCTKENKGNDHWMKLFRNCGAKQFSVVHDGNMQKLYPHIYHTLEYLDGVIAVHDAAFKSCEVLNINCALIPNPHDIPDISYLPIKYRDHGFISLQTFKRWKRVDDLIRAIPHVDSLAEKVIAGGGIEYHYMTSETKCKSEYRNEDGSRIWDSAVEAGMEYLGYLTTEERDAHLSSMKLLIDPSWSKNYSKLGCHFNRVMIEAMCQGCVPVCTDLAMKDSRFFTPNVNYLEVPYDISPEDYGELITSWLEDTKLLSSIQENNKHLVKEFDKSVIAGQIIKFYNGRTPKFSFKGRTTAKFLDDANKKLDHFVEEDW